MKIDVIIPTYNRAQLLWACVQSVFNAEVPDGLRVRVVVVDNNSSDGTREVCKCLSSMPPFKFSYLFVETPGKSVALNAAIEQSDADLIGMIDDDELMDRNWFNVVYREFSRDDELMFLGGQYLPNYECEPPRWIPEEYKAVIGIVLRDKVERFGTECKGIMMGGNAVVRRGALLSVMPYPEHIGRIGNSTILGEDDVMFHRLLDAGFKGISHPDLIIHHWIPRQRMTKSYYRRWVFGDSAGKAFRKPEQVTYLFGIPRYKFRYLITWLLHPFSLLAQLQALDCLGSAYGVWLRFKKGKAREQPVQQELRC